MDAAGMVLAEEPALVKQGVLKSFFQRQSCVSTAAFAKNIMLFTNISPTDRCWRWINGLDN